MTAAMNLERRRELLRSTPYFARIPEAVLDRLCFASTELELRPGQQIFTEGDDEAEAALHIVESGLVRIYKLSPEGREQVLRLMRPGDSFADVPVFDGGPYPANSDAMEPSRVLVLPRKALLDVLRENPDIALGAMQILAARLRHMTSLVEDLSLRRVTSRVARLLLAGTIDVRLNQTQMAAMVGTAREMVNRSLHALAEEGAIAVNGQEIVVVDRAKLEAILDAG
jgi:CRP-like cAMP-binding protein